MKKIIEKYSEIIKYIIAGGMTTVISIVGYKIFLYLGFSLVFANTVSNIIAIIFAFIVNSLFVFKYKFVGVKDLGNKFIEFSAMRIITMIVETFVLYIFVKHIGINEMVAKFITQILVVVSNYLASKLFIYKK